MVTGLGRLSWKIDLITGIGSGIGKDCEFKFAREGAVVAGCDIDAEAERHGGLDLLVNAASTSALAPVEE